MNTPSMKARQLATPSNRTPKVSVCVITFNHEKYISTCLDSILTQETDFEFEVVVCDDCSTDQTQKILKAYAAKYPNIITLICQDTNQYSIGQFSGNLFQIKSIAQGQYVANCDGDDCWLPGKLQYQIDLLDANPNAAQCWTATNLIDDNNIVIGKFPNFFAKILNPRWVSAKQIARSYSVFGQHSTQVYRNYDTLSWDPNNQSLDFLDAFQIALYGPGIYSKKILSNYRLTSSNSVTRNADPDKASVNALSKCLFYIITKHPNYAAQAKAHLIVRYFFSRVRGHNMKIIHDIYTKSKTTKTTPIDIMISLFYFCLEKIPLK